MFGKSFLACAVKHLKTIMNPQWKTNSPRTRIETGFTALSIVLNKAVVK